MRTNSYAIRFAVILALLLGIVATVAAQDGGDGEIKLVIDADNSVVQHGESGDWDARFTVPSVVLEKDGVLHMFRNGYPNWPAPNSVGYLTSEDGVNWTEVQEEPIFAHEEGPYGADMNLVTSALVQADGTWVFYLFLSSLDGIREDPARVHGIARATASSPTDPWQFDEELVLLPGGEGEWDYGFIGTAEIIETETGFVMFYVGGNMNSQVGMATSEDGIHWEKYDDPATTEAPFAESDPVFTPQAAETWEFNNITDIAVVQDGDGWLMFYGSMNTGGISSFSGYNLAFSDDGIHWERLSDEPLWNNRQIKRRPTWTFEMLPFNGELFVWMEIARTYSDTDIFAGRLEGISVE